MSWETSEQRARAIEAYTERLHPRDRSGRWAELPGGAVKTALVRGGAAQSNPLTRQKRGRPMIDPRGPLTGPLAGPVPKGMAWDPRDHSEVRAGEGRPARAARTEYHGFKVGQRVELKAATAGRHEGAFGGELASFEPRDGGARFVAKVRFDNGLVKTFHPAHLVPEGRQSDALTVKSMTRRAPPPAGYYDRPVDERGTNHPERAPAGPPPGHLRAFAKTAAERRAAPVTVKALPLGAINSGLLNLTAPNEAGALDLLKDARLADKRVRMTPLKRGGELWVKDDYSKASVPVRVKDGLYRVGEAMAKLQRAAQRPRASLPPRVITAHSRRAEPSGAGGKAIIKGSRVVGADGRLGIVTQPPTRQRGGRTATIKWDDGAFGFAKVSTLALDPTADQPEPPADPFAAVGGLKKVNAGVYETGDGRFQIVKEGYEKIYDPGERGSERIPVWQNMQIGAARTEWVVVRVQGNENLDWADTLREAKKKLERSIRRDAQKSQH